MFRAAVDEISSRTQRRINRRKKKQASGHPFPTWREEIYGPKEAGQTPLNGLVKPPNREVAEASFKIKPTGDMFLRGNFDLYNWQWLTSG